MDKLIALLEETEISIPGLSQELIILQITDSHLTAADGRESLEVLQMAGERDRGFKSLLTQGTISTLDNLNKHVQLCNIKHADAVVFTGDIIDFPTKLNLELMREAFNQLKAPYMYTMGNHDWSFPHLPSNDDVRLEGYKYFDKEYTVAPGYDAFEIGGVILIAVDNSNYQLTARQFEFIRAQAADGLPCLLFLHIPIYLPSLEADVCAVWRSHIMMGATSWTEEELMHWQTRLPDESTQQFMNWIKHEEGGKAIKGIFCGHVHFNHIDPVGNGSNQYITLAGYAGGSRRIRLVPATVKG